VVVLNFPFSALTQTKRRPALVLAELQGDDLILCQITAQARSHPYSVTLEAGDFTMGGLNQSSRVRPNRLFTSDQGIILYRAGQVTKAKLDEVIARLSVILQQP